MGASNSKDNNNKPDGKKKTSQGLSTVHLKQPRVTSMLVKAAQQTPHQVATISGDRQRTWLQVTERVAKLANALKTKLNLSEGGRVAIVALNSDRYFETFFAVAWAGGIVLPMNIRLAPPEMVEQLTDCQAEIVLVDEAFMSALQPLIAKSLPFVKHVVYCGDAKQDLISLDYERLVAGESKGLSEEACPRGGHDTFGLFYTGGTTGKSKGVELTHSNIFINALGHVGMMNYTTKARYLHSAPMFHLADGASTFGVTMACGSHVFIPKFVPQDMLVAIEKHRVNRAMMVPAMIAMMLQTKEAKTADCSSLENIIYGASPMPPALLEPAMRLFPNATFRQGYGMTETSPAITSLAPEYHVLGTSEKDAKLKSKMASVGKPVDWVEVKIVDKEDREVARGTVGEIVTRGPHVMKGYWGMPEKTAEALRGGWMHTEDGGLMDADGFVSIVDRLKDMIITGGENVYSAEVEGAVMSFEPIAMCAVVGTPDPTFVEVVTAVVVLKSPPKDQAEEEAIKKKLIDHCRTKIANYKVPRRVVVWKELPMSGAGKILKQDIRKKLGTDGLGRSVAAKL